MLIALKIIDISFNTFDVVVWLNCSPTYQKKHGTDQTWGFEKVSMQEREKTYGVIRPLSGSNFFKTPYPHAAGMDSYFVKLT